MNFFSNVVNQIPVVGHVKALMYRDHEAFLQCNRSTVVLAGGILGGPLGAAGAGLALDAAMSTIQGPQGVFRGVCNIVDDIDRGDFPLSSTIGTVLTPALDAFGAKIGANAAGKVYQSAAKIYAAAPVLLRESEKIVVETTAKFMAKEAEVIVNSIGRASVPIICEAINPNQHTDVSYTRSSRSSTGQSDGPTRESSNNSSTSTGSPSAGSPSGGGPPNNPPRRTTETQTINKLIEAILNVLKNYFPSMIANKLKALKKLITAIIKNDRDVRILVIVFAMCETLNIHCYDDVMIFVSLTEFLISYIDEQVIELKDKLTDFDITDQQLQQIIIMNLMNFPCIPDTIGIILNDFTELFKEITGVECEYDISPDFQGLTNFFIELSGQIMEEQCHFLFRDIYSALYHYYKHRRAVCMLDGAVIVLTVTEYFDLLEDVYLQAQRLPLYQQLEGLQGNANTTAARPIIHFDISPINAFSWGGHFKLVIKLQNGRIVVASFYMVSQLL